MAIPRWEKYPYRFSLLFEQGIQELVQNSKNIVHGISNFSFPWPNRNFFWTILVAGLFQNAQGRFTFQFGGFIQELMISTPLAAYIYPINKIKIIKFRTMKKMKRFGLFSTFGLTVALLYSFSEKLDSGVQEDKLAVAVDPMNDTSPSIVLNDVLAAEVLNIDDIQYVEMEEEIDLGFDTTKYLPKEFNPYKHMDMDLNVDEINYMEIEDEINLGFDTSEYLPKGFNAYKGVGRSDR